MKQHHFNTLIYLAASVLNRTGSILLVPLYTRRLSTSEFGSWGFAVTLFSVAPPLLSLGLAAAIGRFFFDEIDPKKRDAKLGVIAGAIAVLSLSLGVVGQVILWALPRAHMAGLSQGQLQMVLWICASVPLAEVPIIYLRSSERALGAAALSLGQFLLMIGTTSFLMLGRGLGVTGMLGGMLMTQGASAIFALWFIFTRLGPRYDRPVLIAAARFSLPLIPHLLGNGLLTSVDRWALAYHGRRDDLGLYTLASQLTTPIGIATSSWNDASAPQFLAAFRDGGFAAARARLPRILLGFVLVGAGALGAVLLILPLLSWWVGERFRPAFGLVPWMGLVLMVAGLFPGFVNVLYLRKSTRAIPLLTLGGVAVSALLNFLLIPVFGVYGAILGTGIAAAARTTLTAVMARRLLQRPPTL